MESTKYASVRVKVETYRDLKKAAIDEGIPFTQLIDKLLALYQEREVSQRRLYPRRERRGFTRFLIKRNASVSAISNTGG